MLKISHTFLLVSLSLLIVACASNDEKDNMNEPGALDLILCEEPESQACTRENDPV